jgi:hypothetical protein
LLVTLLFLLVLMINHAVQICIAGFASNHVDHVEFAGKKAFHAYLHFLRLFLLKVFFFFFVEELWLCNDLIGRFFLSWTLQILLHFFSYKLLTCSSD